MFGRCSSGLLHPELVARATEEPIWCDTTGGWHNIRDLKQASGDLRVKLNHEAAVLKALTAEPPLQVSHRLTAAIPAGSSRAVPAAAVS